MAAPFRWEVDLRTGERKKIDLTPQEISDAQARKALDDAEQGQRAATEAIRARRAALLDQLAQKIDADHTILDRIR